MQQLWVTHCTVRHTKNDPSQIVKVCALQALADLSAHDRALRRQTITILEQVTITGSPAVKSRGRKLLQQLTT